MTFDHYMKFVATGVSLAHDEHRERLMLSGMGLGGEAGEVLDHCKKVAFHGKAMDVDKLVEEMGDVLWYYALMLHTYGLSLDTIMERNVHKLCARYPHKHGSPGAIIEGNSV